MLCTPIRTAATMALALFAATLSQSACAQQIEHGITVQHGWLNTRTAIEPIQVKNTNGDSGEWRVRRKDFVATHCA